MARSKYTLGFKREAVRLVREEKMTYTQVGTDLELDKSIIRDGCSLGEAGKFEASPSPGSDSRQRPAGSKPRVRVRTERRRRAPSRPTLR